MDLWKEILAAILSREETQITFPNITINPAEMVDGVCYQALEQIKSILEDDEPEDPECFLKIEEIVCTLEALGIFCGARHDF